MKKTGYLALVAAVMVSLFLFERWVDTQIAEDCENRGGEYQSYGLNQGCSSERGAH